MRRKVLGLRVRVLEKHLDVVLHRVPARIVGLPAGFVDLGVVARTPIFLHLGEQIGVELFTRDRLGPARLRILAVDIIVVLPGLIEQVIDADEVVTERLARSVAQNEVQRFAALDRPREGGEIGVGAGPIGTVCPSPAADGDHPGRVHEKLLSFRRRLEKTLNETVLVAREVELSMPDEAIVTPERIAHGVVVRVDPNMPAGRADCIIIRLPGEPFGRGAMAKKPAPGRIGKVVSESKIAMSYRLSREKIARPPRILGTSTATATIEQALDLVSFRRELVDGVDRAFGIQVADVFPVSGRRKRR